MELQPLHENPWARRIDTDIGREQRNHYQSIVVRLVGLGGAVLLSLLAARFIFMLFGANVTNGLVTFVYGFTGPFVTPFAGLFNYDHLTYGVSTFEGFTLVAIAFYALIAAGLRRLATLAWW